jgi:hypothetical protein
MEDSFVGVEGEKHCARSPGVACDVFPHRTEKGLNFSLARLLVPFFESHLDERSQILTLFAL